MPAADGKGVRRHRHSPGASCAVSAPPSGTEIMQRGETRGPRHAGSLPSGLHDAREPPFGAARGSCGMTVKTTQNGLFCVPLTRDLTP